MHAHATPANASPVTVRRLLQRALVAVLVAASACSIAIPARAAAALQDRFQAALDALREESKFPGATAAYILPDGSVGAAATGLADVEARVPMTPQSRMLAASIGKSFVAATVLALAHEGRLSLCDPLAKWLGDERWFPRLPNHQSIALQHLLMQTSGLPDHVHLSAFAAANARDWNKPGNPFPPERLVGFILDQPPLFKPGEGWSYTDTGYILLGMVIEKVTGHTYYEEATHRFLEPLHLSETSPSDKPNLPGLAAGYLEANNEWHLPVKTTSAPGMMVWNPGQEWTGGGLISTPRDLVMWAKTLYEGRAMNWPYVQKLLLAVPIEQGSPDVLYGAAVAIKYGGPLGPTYGHGGWIPGYSSSMRYYTKYHIAVALQINTDRGIVEHHRTPLTEDMEVSLARVVVESLPK
jgi:D-alanyl-D-alanine carboxypeptidase